MTLELYPGYLNLGGNEVINNPRVRGLLENTDCPAGLIADGCNTLEDALTPPTLSDWAVTSTNLMTNPSFEAGTTETILRTNLSLDPYVTLGNPAMYESLLITAAAAPATYLYGYPGGVRLTPTGNGAGRWSIKMPHLKPSTQYSIRFIMTTNVTTGGLNLEWRPTVNVNASVVPIITGMAMNALTTYSFTGTWTTPATVTADSGIVWAGNVVTSRWYDITAILVEEAATAGGFFAGDMPPAGLINMSSNPSFETTSATQPVVTTNYAVGGTGISAGTTTGSVALTRPDPTYLHVEQTVQGNLAWTDAWRCYAFGSSSARVAMVPGGQLSLYAEMRSNRSRSFQWKVTYWDDAGTNLLTSTQPFFAIPSATDWTPLQFVSAAAPAGTTKVSAWIQSGGAASGSGSSTGMLVGDWYEVRKPAVVYSATQQPYFDGETPAAGDLAYKWTGAPHASTSQRVGALSTVGVSAIVGTAISSTEWSSSRTRSLRLIASQESTSNSTRASLTQVPVVAGASYTILATMRLAAPQPVLGTWSNARKISVYWAAGATLVYSAQAPNEAGVFPLRLDVTVPAGETLMDVRLNHGGLPGSPDMWWDDILIVANPDPLVPYAGSYFDGYTPQAVYSYRWRGTPDASPSFEYDAARPVRWTGTANASTSQVYEVAPALTTPVNAVLLLSTTWAEDRTQSMRVVSSGGSSTGYASIGGSASGLSGNGVTFTPGHTYVVTGTVRLTESLSGTLSPYPAAMAYFDSVSGTTAAAYVFPSNVAGVTRLELNFTVPVGATAAELRLYNGASTGAVWWDAIMLLDITAGSALTPYFDGATPAANGLEQYAWTGTADTSTSTRETRYLITAPDYADRDVADAPWYDLDLPAISGGFYGAYAIDVTQMHDSTREVSVSESILNGGTIGRMRLGTKEVLVRAMLFAENSASLEYGRAWLEAATLPGACGQHGDRCGVTDLAFYADCPPTVEDYPETGTGYTADVLSMERYLHGVAVTSGPTTTDEYILVGSDLVAQIVEFTITSERPWVYGSTRDADVVVSEQSQVIQDTPFNLVPYPSAELGSGSVVVATNYSKNPSLEANVTGWVATAATVSGTSPAAYFTNGRVSGINELVANGTYSMRARILGNNSTEVASSTSDLTIYQDVVLPARPTPHTGMSVTIWAGVSIGATGSAVTSVSSVKAELLWRDDTGATLLTQPIATAANATERAGMAYRITNIEPPDDAVEARVRVIARVTWRSSATASNNSDVRLYADALALSIP